MPLSIAIITEQDEVIAKMSGAIDEFSDQGFRSLLPLRNGKIYIDLAEIKSINSLGVRSWLNFMQNFRQTHDVVLRNAVPDVVMQINMIPAFLGVGTVESFQAPYYCASCKRTFHKHFLTSQTRKVLLGELKTQPCDACRANCECEEGPEDYIQFLR